MYNLGHLIHAGGFVVYPLLALSFVATFTIIERLLAFGQTGRISQVEIERIIALVRDGRFDDAVDVCTNRSGPLASCIVVILRHRDQPSDEVESLVEETGQRYFVKLERFLPILDTTTTISPLLGLLGTVVGMIGAFDAVSAQAASGSNNGVLPGVGQALVATAMGLIIAIISFIFYNYFSARLRSIVSDTEIGATSLINALNNRRRIEQGKIHFRPLVDGQREEDRDAIQTAHRA